VTTRRRAVVLGPVQPTFDPRFFDPITAWLRARGYAVEVLDTLDAVADPSMTVSDAAEEWLSRKPDITTSDLLCGNAFGGAVIQAMLPAVRPDIPVMLLSAPTVANALLSTRLNEVARHARIGNLAGALWTLDDHVRSALLPSPPMVSVTPAGDSRTSCRRIDLGMSLLASIDLSAPVARHQGPVLSVIGGRSRLVSTTHVRVPGQGVIAEIPDAGMRPHRDNWIAVEQVLNSHRDYLGGVADRCRSSQRIDTEGAA
jgi:pimeloyl-ACP methyl ester carboxylesterase